MQPMFDRGKKSTRRTFLASTASVSAAFLTSTVSAGKKNGDTPNVSVVKGKYGNPISTDTVRKVRQRHRSQAAQPNSETSASVATTPELNPGQRLVSYVVGIDDKGTLRQSFGVATSSHADERARSQADIEGKRLSNELTTDSTVTTQSSSWSSVEDSKLTTYAPPYGDLVNNYEILNYGSDAGFTYKDDTSMYPGANNAQYNSDYGTDWINDNTYEKVTWSDYDSTTEIQDRYPRTETGSTTSQTVGVSGTLSTTGGSVSTTYEYSYTQTASTVNDDSYERGNIAAWTMKANSGSALENVMSFMPSTMADTSIDCNDSGYKIFDVATDATFENKSTGNTQTISTSLYFDLRDKYGGHTC